MTYDLVNELRVFADDGYPHLSLEAADRIEQLIAERAHAWEMAAKADTQMGQSLADHLQAKAERDRLRIALTDAESYLGKGLDKMAYNILRAALKGEKPIRDLLPCRFCRFAPRAWLDDYINGRAVTDPEYIIECENGNCSVMPRTSGTYPYMDEVRALWNAANALPAVQPFDCECGQVGPCNSQFCTPRAALKGESHE